MKAKAFAAALISIVAIGASPASAEGDNDRLQMLSKADANQDGAITWNEVVEMRKTMFSRLDRNKDGFADQADRPRGRVGRKYTEKLSELIPQFDANRDGRIARSEFIDAPSPAFEAGDLDNDKTLSPDELAALRSAHSARADRPQ
ncbi:MAG: hypothetical protein GC152_13360 [Alphaproteobacteria bacterium]|nr:hypothetical protein [Alphaproteobacteria bacterium]